MFPPFIDVLRKRDNIVVNKREYPNAKDGDGVVVTYTFLTRVPDRLQTDTLVDAHDSFERYKNAEKKVIRKALKAWSSVADVTFVEVASEDAQLRFGKHNMPYKVNGYAGGLTYHLEQEAMVGADIWLDWKGFLLTPYGQEIATHEVGHALGLAHPYVGKQGLKKAEFPTTIMGYSLWDDPPYKGSPTKLGIIDTAVIQSIYGPAQKRLGNDTYKLDKTKLIWDGGGIDTISAAGAKAKAFIDLNDGSWSRIGKKASSILAKGQSWLGHYTQIENAVGSKHADRIMGNELDNLIRGGGGNDTIQGGEGADALYGNQGSDTFVFASFAEMGTLERCDTIMDFGPGDRIDLRGLGLTFVGTGTSDAVLNASTTNQFYFNTTTQQLRFDANGDRTVDHVIAVPGAGGIDSFLL